MRLIPRLLVTALSASVVFVPAPASAAGLTCAAGEICFNDYAGHDADVHKRFWTTTSYNDETSTHYDNYFYGTSTRGRDAVHSVWNRKPSGVRVIDWRDGADSTFIIPGYSGTWNIVNGLVDKNNNHQAQ